MAERLGEYLVQHGIVTEQELATVLKRQVVMGGRLGTNLIELGYIGEDELVQFLSQKFSIPAAQPGEFDSIPPDTVRLVPSNLARKYGAIPLKLERKSLRLAMVNPLDVDAIAQLGFAAGCSIKPCVASEARVQYALERYYHVVRDLRYVSILSDDRKTEPAKRARAPSPKASGGNLALSEFEVLKEQLVGASDRDQVIELLLKFLGSVLDRVFFMAVGEGQLAGWIGHVPGMDAASIRKIRVPLNEASLFRDAVEKKEWKTAHEPILKGLGPDVPSYVVVLPLVLEGAVIGLVYGDDALRHSSPQKKTELLLKAMDKAALALRILILKGNLLKI